MSKQVLIKIQHYIYQKDGVTKKSASETQYRLLVDGVFKCYAVAGCRKKDGAVIKNISQFKKYCINIFNLKDAVFEIKKTSQRLDFPAQRH